jgi:hypothetical protein
MAEKVPGGQGMHALLELAANAKENLPAPHGKHVALLVDAACSE